MPSLNSQLTPLGKGQIWIIFSLFYDGSSLYIEGGGLNGARSIYFVSYWDNHPSFTSHYVLELYSHVCTHYGAFLHPDMKLFKSVFYRILLYNTISWAFDNKRFRLLSVQIHEANRSLLRTPLLSCYSIGNCSSSSFLVSKQLLFAKTNRYPGNSLFTLLRTGLISEGVVVGSRCMVFQQMLMFCLG